MIMSIIVKVSSLNTCDMIKGNESDVADIGFEILAKKEFESFCFTWFLSVEKLMVIL